MIGANNSTSHSNIPTRHIVINTSESNENLTNWNTLEKEKVSPISKSRLEELEFLEKNLDIIIKYEVYKSVKAGGDNRIDKK